MSILPSFLQELSDTKTIKEDDSQVVKMPREYGEEYINTDCESEISDALLINEYIESIEDFEAVRNSDSLNISFRVVTKFGSVEVDENVRR